MKLASHYNKVSVIISVSVLLVSGLVYYLIINHIARQQLDDGLSEEVAEVVNYVAQNHKLPKPVEFDEDQTSFAKTTLTHFDTRFFDAPYANPKEKKVEAGRAVSALINADGENYVVTIIESREDTEYLIQIISAITLALTAVLLGILIITNRYVLNGLWRPFYRILDQVKWFNVADAGKVAAVDTKVDEFKDLGDAVAKMSARVTLEYQGLKAFTENASHEMMTPLAVITSKLDMLIQDETLQPDQFAQITDIYSAASRLSRINQSLLLLVKIDNNLLQDTEKLNVEKVIMEKAQQFHEMIINKNIQLDMELTSLEINASRYLIDVLINNLFSNAIRHNKNSGNIKIELSGNRLQFQNTGDPNPLQQDAIFERFYKGRTSDGTGLGLAIIKNICALYHCEIKYAFKKGMHCFCIDFFKPV
ncbi:HAMP domain-containing sensor histidine kinase [Mucilaginibacter sp.]|uniref:sensor histidine kinase n=1 Tax=Mucilaginibacter sp. TaxID=1882438 RepID=UPI0028403C08|nr:HAMP domain-containing sensor histidine kinase [Mucilaginibacter sp.]MDR3696861.1 HAMP domain-containing sensor histidine kinase [Mucilaginibacter sp.]